VGTLAQRDMYSTRQSSLNPNPSTLEPDRPQLDRPAACVIAQQYSSTAFFSLRFNSRNERLAAV